MRAALPCFEQAGRYNAGDLRFFKGRFPNSLARRYYGDRFVMVGDAAGLVRAFKGKGVTTAVQTGIRAAKTILRTGISEHAFAVDFAVENRDITDDLVYGRGMRLLVAFSALWGCWIRWCGRLDETATCVRRCLAPSRPTRPIARSS